MPKLLYSLGRLCVFQRPKVMSPSNPYVCQRCFSKFEAPPRGTRSKGYFMLETSSFDKILNHHDNTPLHAYSLWVCAPVTKVKEVDYFLLDMSEVIPVTTFCLGTWQVYRRQWKLDLIQEMEQRVTAQPVALPENLDELEDMEYMKIKVRGSFDHSKEVRIAPRSLITNDEHQHGGGLGSTSPMGAQVVVPFHLADRDLTILINRGWVPRDKQNPETRRDSQIEGEIDLTGVVRKSERGSMAFLEHDMSNGNWYSRDIPNLAEHLGTAQVFLDADGGSTIPGGPIGGQTNVTIRNEHVSYIITWYSLCIATLFLWYTRMYKAPPIDPMVKYLKQRKLN